MSAASIEVLGKLGSLVLGGYSSRMSEYDSFELLTRHRFAMCLSHFFVPN